MFKSGDRSWVQKCWIACEKGPVMVYCTQHAARGLETDGCVSRALRGRYSSSPIPQRGDLWLESCFAFCHLATRYRSHCSTSPAESFARGRGFDPLVPADLPFEGHRIPEMKISPSRMQPIEQHIFGSCLPANSRYQTTLELKHYPTKRDRRHVSQGPGLSYRLNRCRTGAKPAEEDED
jgi:hypothetical protein